MGLILRALTAALLALALFAAPAWAANVSLTNSGWTKIASAGATTTVQVLSVTPVRIQQSATPPSTFDGDVMVAGTSTEVRTFEAPLPNDLYAIALGSGAIVSVQAIGSGTSTADPSNAAFAGAVAMTVGSTYAAGRSIALVCSVSGNVSFTFSDSSTLVVPVAVGFSSFPFAVTAVNTSGTTATCTYANLK